MARYEDRLARAFSMIINVLDPDVIVVGAASPSTSGSMRTCRRY